jgi:PKD repeat protein
MTATAAAALVDFVATATTTPTGVTIERYEWAFGDGSTLTTSGGSTNHKYSAGTYTVTVRAVTTTGASGTAQRVIVVP